MAADHDRRFQSVLGAARGSDTDYAADELEVRTERPRFYAFPASGLLSARVIDTDPKALVWVGEDSASAVDVARSRNEEVGRPALAARVTITAAAEYSAAGEGDTDTEAVAIALAELKRAGGGRYPGVALAELGEEQALAACLKLVEPAPAPPSL